jgi:hypothetical protein
MVLNLGSSSSFERVASARISAFTTLWLSATVCNRGLGRIDTQILVRISTHRTRREKSALTALDDDRPQHMNSPLNSIPELRRKVSRELPFTVGPQAVQFDWAMPYWRMMSEMTVANLAADALQSSIAFAKLAVEAGLDAWPYEFGVPNRLTHAATLVRVGESIYAQDAFFNSGFDQPLATVIEALLSGKISFATAEAPNLRVAFVGSSDSAKTKAVLAVNADRELRPLGGIRRFAINLDQNVYLSMLDDADVILQSLTKMGLPPVLDAMTVLPLRIMVDGNWRDALSCLAELDPMFLELGLGEWSRTRFEMAANARRAQSDGRGRRLGVRSQRRKEFKRSGSSPADAELSSAIGEDGRGDAGRHAAADQIESFQLMQQPQKSEFAALEERIRFLEELVAASLVSEAPASWQHGHAPANRPNVTLLSVEQVRGKAQGHAPVFQTFRDHLKQAPKDADREVSELRAERLARVGIENSLNEARFQLEKERTEVRTLRDQLEQAQKDLDRKDSESRAERLTSAEAKNSLEQARRRLEEERSAAGALRDQFERERKDAATARQAWLSRDQAMELAREDRERTIRELEEQVNRLESRAAQMKAAMQDAEDDGARAAKRADDAEADVRRRAAELDAEREEVARIRSLLNEADVRLAEEVAARSQDKLRIQDLDLEIADIRNEARNADDELSALHRQQAVERAATDARYSDVLSALQSRHAEELVSVASDLAEARRRLEEERSAAGALHDQFERERKDAATARQAWLSRDQAMELAREDRERTIRELEEQVNRLESRAAQMKAAMQDAEDDGARAAKRADDAEADVRRRAAELDAEREEVARIRSLLNEADMRLAEEVAARGGDKLRIQDLALEIADIRNEAQEARAIAESRLVDAARAATERQRQVDVLLRSGRLMESSRLARWARYFGRFRPLTKLLWTEEWPGEISAKENYVALAPGDVLKLNARMSAKPWIGADGDNFVIPADSPREHVLWGPYIHFPGGRYLARIEVRSVDPAPGKSDSFVLEAVKAEKPFAQRQYFLNRLASGSAELSFVVPRGVLAEPFELRLIPETSVAFRIGSVEVARLV